MDTYALIQGNFDIPANNKARMRVSRICNSMQLPLHILGTNQKDMTLFVYTVGVLADYHPDCALYSAQQFRRYITDATQGEEGTGGDGAGEAQSSNHQGSVEE